MTPLRLPRPWLTRVIDADLPSTTGTALVKARVGQSLFRERVSRIERSCRITFIDNPAHSIGSHIKPWREGSNDERWEGTKSPNCPGLRHAS